MSLSTRTCLLLKTAIVAVPLLALAAHYSSENYHDIVAEEKAKLRRAASAIHVVNVSLLTGARMVLESVLAQQAVVRENWPACSENLTRFLAWSEGYLNAGVADAAGALRCSGATPMPFPIGKALINVSDRDWFRRALDNDTYALGDYVTGRVTGKPTITVAKSIRQPNNAIVAAFLAIDLNWLGRLIIQQVKLPEQFRIFVTDRAGTVITAMPDSAAWLGKSFAGTAFFDAAKANPKEAVAAPFLDGEDMLMAALPVVVGDTPALYVIAATPRKDVEAAALAGAEIYIGSILLGTFVLLFLAWLFAERMVRRPLALVSATVEKLSAGDTGARIGAITATSEIATVAGAFDRMADTLSARDAKLLLANKDLQAARDMLGATLDASPAVIISLDTNGRATLWNPAAELVFGWKEEEILGHACPIRREDGAPAFEEFFDRAMNDETVMNIQETFMTKDARKLRVSVNAKAIHGSDNRHAGVVFVVNDITAILQTERALLQSQKMEAVGQLTGGLAHDFNNLLAVMIGNLDLLQENASIDAETREIQQEALDAALRGAELTRQLLAFSRRQPLQPKRTNLNDLVTSTARLLKKVLGENITIRTRLADRPWTIMADPSQVETSLMNLAINARDAMAQGGTLLVETANVVLDEDYVRLNHEVVPGEYAMMAVSDSGSGMAPEIVARVFEPFFTTKPAGKGTGLGLSMVYGFVKQSGGHAKVYSEVGVGTTIRLYFPKARDDVADPGSAAEDEPAPPAAKGETVLVVEDKDDVRRVACRQLRKYGYNVIDAENGSVALDILRSGRPVDLLFTDVVMPGDWSGPALAEEARKLRPGLKLLFASGFPGMVLPPQMLAEGNGFISKPYRHQELNRMIRRILGDDDA